MNKQLIKNLWINTVDRIIPRAGTIDLNGGYSITNYKSLKLNAALESMRARVIRSDSLLSIVTEENFGMPCDFIDALVIEPDLSLAINEDICNKVYSYLGDGAKIDSVALAIFNLIQDEHSVINHNRSGLFHHDSVGSRLKLFVPLNITGTANFPTEYIKNTHKKKWESYLNDYSNSESRIDFEKCGLNKKYIEELKIEFGSGAIFDTNGAHRGVYNSSKDNRIILQFEFSSYKTYFPGKVGPREFHMNEVSYNHLRRFGLLRSAAIHERNGIYIHRGRPRRNSENIYTMGNLI